MQLGIFARTFPRRHFAEALDTVAALGLRCIQFNFSCVGLPTLPEAVPPEIITTLQKECTRRDISIAGVSATFNMIDPDDSKRRAGLARLPALAQAARALDCELLTLCTGTRDPDDMWRAHPENSSAAAWTELKRSMEAAIAVAEAHGVTLGVEPEIGNVVSSARKARQLLDELSSPRVKIVLDPANLFPRRPVTRVRDTIEEAFQLLGTDIVMAHAKEISASGDSGTLPPGRGVIDWNYFLGTLARMEFRRPVVLHGFPEADAAEAVRFIRSKLPD